MIYDVAIIGGGPIGLYSVFSCGLEGLSCVVFDSASQLGGQCKYLYAKKNIYDIPGHKSITGENLINNLLEQISVFNYDVFLNSFIQTINEVDGLFIVDNGQAVVSSKSVLISLGAGIYKPIKLNIDYDCSLENHKIFYEVKDLSKFANKNVAILGGGDSAIDYANDLSNVASSVHLIHRRKIVTANHLGFQKVKSLNNVTLHMPYIIDSVENCGDIMLINGDYSINVDIILVCYGLSSDISFLREWNLQLKNNKILVNIETMKTSREKVYAIGDCVTYEGKRNLLVTGFAESAIASRAIFKKLYPNKAFNVSYSTNFFNN